MVQAAQKLGQGPPLQSNDNVVDILVVIQRQIPKVQTSRFHSCSTTTGGRCPCCAGRAGFLLRFWALALLRKVALADTVEVIEIEAFLLAEPAPSMFVIGTRFGVSSCFLLWGRYNPLPF